MDIPSITIGISNQAEFRISTLVDSMRDAILMEDENRFVLLANKSFCAFFGIPAPPAALVGVDCSQSAEQTKGLFTDPEGFIAEINKVLADRVAVYNQVLELVDGRVLERDYVPIFDNSRFAGQLWQYRDITEKVRTQKELEVREQKYRSLIENMHLGLLEVDLNENILFTNQSFSRLTGYDNHELLGQNAMEMFLPEEQKLVMSNVQNRRKEGSSDVYEIKVKNKDGETLWMMISGAPTYDEHNNVIGSIGIHLDITQRKLLERDLVEARLRAEAASRTREEFLAMVSHEVRTPLAAILGLQKILEKELLSPNQKKLIDQTLRAGEHLLGIINNILDFSKLSSGKFELNEHFISLPNTLRQVVDILQVRAEEKDIQLSYFIDEKIGASHYTDDRRITQILMNLIGNAIKFTEHGFVNVRLEVLKESKVSQFVLLSVQDSGIGIAEEDFTRVFDVFDQGKNNSPEKFGGTGLGLSICRHLIELMGGKIWVESEVGKGSTFHLTLELENGKADKIYVQKEKNPKSGQLKGVRILVVEDNEINMLIAQTLLTNQGAIVGAAINGKLGVEEALKNPYDIIFMDLQMPEMNGTEATSSLRQLGYTKPILALTANALVEKKHLINHAGFTDLLTKPFTEFELVSKVLHLVSPNMEVELLTQKENIEIAEPSQMPLPYSLNRLRKLAQSDEEFVQRMLQMAKVQLKETARQLEAETAAKNWNNVASIAHKIRPTLDSLEALSLAESSREVERNLSAEIRDKVSTSLSAKFTDELKQFVAVFEQE